MPTKMFAKEVLREDVLDWEYVDNSDYEVIEDNMEDQSRWSIIHYLVFKEKSTGKIYGVSYSEGATECQDESPFEYDNDEIECRELEAVEVTRIEYQPVKD